VIAILAVGPRIDPSVEPPSSIEVLHAHDAEDAVEKLGRNRRIDAVLILEGTETAAVVAAIREDILAPPPIFRAGDASPAEGARALPAASTELPALLEALAADLEAEVPGRPS
jgi:hypothetical protein